MGIKTYKRGNARYLELTISDLASLGLSNDAIINITGKTTITGADDTVVLEVKKQAVMEDYLKVEGLFDVGTRTGNGEYGYDGSTNPGPVPGGAGLTVSPATGNLRTDGKLLSGLVDGPLVLKASDGHYYKYSANAGGVFNTVGVDLGTDEP